MFSINYMARPKLRFINHVRVYLIVGSVYKSYSKVARTLNARGPVNYLILTLH